MNKAHRTVWNTALEAWVAVPETGTGQGQPGGSREAHAKSGATMAPALHPPSALCVALMLAGLLGMTPVRSQVLTPGLGGSSAGAGGGGNGGAFTGDGGGAGGANGDNLPGAVPSAGNGGDGRAGVAGAGGSGGVPGSAGVVGSEGFPGPVAGGAGGAAVGAGSGGGGGGVGGIVAAGVFADLFDNVSGGAGGAGAAGGGGGGGGAALIIGNGTLLVSSGVAVAGGDGGAGAAGGGGGAGVVYGAGGGYILNLGLIAGGKGGSATASTAAGSGGSALIGEGLSVQNYGTIRAGAAGVGGGATAGAAVHFTGGSNSLNFFAGSSVDGAVWVGSGADAALTAFDVDSYGIGGLVLDGAATLDLSGGSKLTVSGPIVGTAPLSVVDIATATGLLNLAAASGNYSGSVSVSGVTVNVGADQALGTGAVSFQDSPLAGAANATLANSSLTFTGGTARIDAASGTTLTLLSPVELLNTDMVIGASGNGTVAADGVVSGTGALTHAGTGTLVLAADNTYSGGTTIDAGGTVQVGAGGGAGTLGSGAVTDNGALVFNRADDFTFNNAVSGAGTLSQNGTGTLRLPNANTYAGGSTLNSGTLVLGNNLAMGSGALTVNGGTLGADGAVALDNNVAANGDFGVGGALVFNKGLALNADVHITAVPLPAVGIAASQLTLDGVISGSHSLVLDSTLADGNGRFIFQGKADNSYVGALGAQGNALVLLNRPAGTATITGDFTIAGHASVLLGASNQIADSAVLTVNSTGQLLDAFGPPTRVEGFAFNTWGGAADMTETVAGLQGNGSIGLGSGILRVGSGNFSGSIGDGELAAYLAGLGQGTLGGKLEKIGAGTLTLSGANTYSGGTALKQGRLDVGSNGALGSGELAMDDGTTLGFAANGLTLANDIRMTGSNDPVIDTGNFSATLAGVISGGGFLTKEGAGTLTLTGANSYTGGTNVATGTLRAGAVNTFSGASAFNVASGATLDLAGYNQTLASLNNSGIVSLAGATPGTTLTVTGPWVGNGGVLRLGTALGSNGSATDRLVLRGSSAVASGSTGVQITNLGGLGGQTVGNGIEIVGTESGASLQPGAFALAAPVTAGAYEYRLASTASAAYLSSTLPPPPTPPTPPAPPAPAPAGLPIYRADVPLFAALPAQLREADLAMLGNRHQRSGDDGAAPSDGAGSRQAWGRIISTDRRITQAGTVSPTSEGRLNGFQAGTDLWADTRWHAGVYVGQLDGDQRVSGFARGMLNYAAGGNDLRSQYLGAYATWQNADGFYVDGVLQAARHRATVAPTLSASSAARGDSLLASIELGQAYEIAPRWRIEPQLQLVHQRLNLDDTPIVGAAVQQHNANGWTVRAGLRIQGEIDTAAGTLQPYARFNVYKRGSGTDVTRFIGPAAFTDIATRTGGTSSELAVGATWALGSRTSVYGELGKLWASGGDARMKSGLNTSVGVKLRW